MEGNQMKMREALLNIQEYAAAMDVDDGNVLAILDACRDALAAPERQCDVGTAEEQLARFNDYCNARVCMSCGMPANLCRFWWAQTPYEAEEGGAS